MMLKSQAHIQKVASILRNEKGKYSVPDILDPPDRKSVV